MQDWLTQHREAIVEETKPTLDLSEWWWHLINFREVEQAINKWWKYCWYTTNEEYLITRNNGERKEYETSQYEKIVLPERLLPKTVIDILNTLWLDKDLETRSLREALRRHKKDHKPHWFLNKQGTTIWVCDVEEWGKPTTKYYTVNKKTYSI